LYAFKIYVNLIDSIERISFDPPQRKTLNKNSFLKKTKKKKKKKKKKEKEKDVHYEVAYIYTRCFLPLGTDLNF